MKTQNYSVIGPEPAQPEPIRIVLEKKFNFHLFREERKKQEIITLRRRR